MDLSPHQGPGEGVGDSDLSAAIEAEAARLQASLNLELGPIMRVGYFDLGSDRPARLMIVVHHLAMDGLSWRILLEDLQTVYGQLQQGMPVPFAKGGVIASPMTFPLGNGGTGLAGEAGSEAIMPLARGSDGRLGVSARGGGANVTVNISTPDVESFRRSETQLAAILTRTVATGQRNL